MDGRRTSWWITIKAKLLARLDTGIRRCVKYPLHKSRRHAVPGEGAIHAPILLVGEAPGKLKDQQGHPFCGRAGPVPQRPLPEMRFEAERAIYHQ